ncbi:MAG: LysR family transcriptional regulator [Ruminiclostridium sp.]|nr:LysR family transcriptional regulator [Ruminiclostridium sp.]
MELRLLEYFLTVVREENISKAAEVLHVTQPTLSRQMKELEDELNTTLFIRGKRLTLTDAGVMLRRRAEEVVSLMQKIDSEFREQEEISGVVSVGSGGLKAAEILPELIGHFRERYPLVSFELHTGTADHVKERLEHGLLDFGILLEPVDVEKFDYLRLPAKETWGLLMSADHPLAREKSIARKLLKGQPLVVTSRTALRGEIEEWLRCPISELDIVATMNLINNAAPLAERGLACVLTIEGAVDMFDPARFAFRPLTPELSFTSVLAWKKLSPYSGAAGKFLEYIKSVHAGQ